MAVAFADWLIVFRHGWHLTMYKTQNLKNWNKLACLSSSFSDMDKFLIFVLAAAFFAIASGHGLPVWESGMRKRKYT